MRSKDIYDLDHLVSLRPWSGQRVAEAVQLTFTRRRLALPRELPIMFTPNFFENPMKLSQWEAFAKKVSHVSLKTMELPVILNQLQAFWWPLLQALQAGQSFDAVWNPATRQWDSDKA